MPRHTTVPLLVAVTLVLTAVPAFAAKGGNGNGGYPGSLWATPNVVHAGDELTVAGCGYDASYGGVVVAFAGGSWGAVPDADGCFSIPHIPALAGDTLPAGTYEVSAFQYVRKRLVERGATEVTVLP
jgi:hypothetical protein